MANGPNIFQMLLVSISEESVSTNIGGYTGENRESLQVQSEHSSNFYAVVLLKCNDPQWSDVQNPYFDVPMIKCERNE